MGCGANIHFQEVVQQMKVSNACTDLCLYLLIFHQLPNFITIPGSINWRKLGATCFADDVNVYIYSASQSLKNYF